MKSVNPNFGLVLAGGGAKGAYQAGACRYLDEIGFEPQIIAGTSIGALNGAVLASNQSFQQGVRRQNELWDELGKEILLRPNISQFITPERNSIYDPKTIETILRKAVYPAKLRQGIELWVNIFPSWNIPGKPYIPLMALIDFTRGKIGTKAGWRCVQDCEDDDTLFNLLLASAAIPIAFPQREIDGRVYVDGFVGNGGNIPFDALEKRGCNFVIVIHLENGVTWNRHHFPNQKIIEIRPQQPINDSIIAPLNFTAERIAELKERGYQDAKYYMSRIIETLRTVGEWHQSQQKQQEMTFRLKNDPPLLPSTDFE